MKIAFKFLSITLILMIYSCYDENKKSSKIQAMNSDEDTIATVGYILYYDKDVKYSFFVPVEDSIIENNIL